MEQIRVAIANRQSMSRAGLRLWIEQESDLTVIGEAETSGEVLRICEFERPDVLIQEILLHNGDGIEVIRRLRSAKLAVRILAISGVEHSRAERALEAGADGFLASDERRGVVLEAIRWAATKTTGTWLSPLVAHLAVEREECIRKHHLTRAEQDVITMLKCPNKEIAKRLFVTEGTVKNHISTIYSKLGLRTRQQTIDWAEQNGLQLTSDLQEDL